MDYQRLLMKLADTRLVEDGFTERDLALGVLISFFDFDLERALGRCPPPAQKRVISFNCGQESIVVYAHLSEQQFEAIQHFASQEKWPFKAQGLFLFLKKEQYKEDPSLLEAFYLTQEFAAVEELFQKSISKEEIISMIQEGDWGLLSAFVEKQKKMRDLSPENRQKLLLSYIKANSKNAAGILIKTDYAFALKKLSDPTVLGIVRLLDHSEIALRFLHGVATSPRSDPVRTLAVAQYQELSGRKWEPLVVREPVKPKEIEKAIAQKSSATLPPLKKPEAKPASKPVSFLYTVQDGDSLWKIAKRFSVPVEDIRRLNQLSNDSLKPGNYLKVPDRSLRDAKGGTSKVVSR
jgi:LysM repeat protein